MKKEIELKPKKPKLAYVGMDKKTLAEAVPTQVVEIVYPHKSNEEEKKGETLRFFHEGQIGTGKIIKSADFPKNRLIWTNDNLVALKTLLDEKDSISGEHRYRNKIDLIYIDPPFMVQNDFVAENSIDIEVDEEEGVMSVKEPTIIETIAYKDTWKNGLDSFLQMMRERLLLMKELLAPTGSIYVHLDWHTSHYVKVLMDEIFEYQNFRNEVVWCYDKWPAPSNDFQKDHDVILRYSKTDDYYFRSLREIDDKRQLTLDRGYTTNLLKNGEKQLIVYKGSENKENIKALIKSNKFARVIYKDPEGNPLRDYWLINKEHPKALERTGYPTQKPIELLLRIIETSCPKNGVILDSFMGSGTTCKATEQMTDGLNYTWIGIDNSKFAVHTARKRLIELNGKQKSEKNAGVYKVRPFTVENMGYYQRGVKWDPIQVGNQADAYRQAIIELFGGEYTPYSKLLHGKKRGAWIHVGPLSQPIVSEQIQAIAKEVKDTDFKKCYVLSADFTAHLNQAVEKAKEEFGVQVFVRMIPASAIEEVKKRLELIKQGVKSPEKVSDMPNIAFFAPLAVKVHKVVDGKEASIELSGLEVDVESFLESQKPERRDELKKWLEKEKSWQSFVDFWAVDWNYENLKNEEDGHGPIFENEWQSFRKRKGKKVVEDLIFKAFHTYEKSGEYTIAVKVVDIFGNDGIVMTKVVIK
ncbi:MAG: methylase N-4/N-6 domain protein [Parcubacteria group bacterium GW2011_GWA2_47_21]|nr:MAG: methylase N-4/N-6 domain protein [Parcubacteria group bacterium GW2011_GWA2_47_21]